MTGNSARSGSDLAQIDAYENTMADYDEIPELTEKDFLRGVWHIGDRQVGEVEGRAAMAAALVVHPDSTGTSDTELVALSLERDVLMAFRERGPDWRIHVNAALRKAVGV